MENTKIAITMRDKLRLCLEIIAGRKTRTELVQEEFAMLFNEDKFLKPIPHDYPDETAITDQAIEEVLNMFDLFIL